MKWLGTDHWLLPDGRHLLLCKAKVLGVGPGTFADFTGSTDDGYIQGYHGTTYATARSTSTDYNITSTAVIVGQWKSGAAYLVFRSYLSFDTSAIPDEATVSDVKLHLKVNADYSAADFVVQIYKFDWASPIGAANREANYDASGSTYDQDWRSTAGISAGSWYANATSLDTAWVNKAGVTRYMLKSDEDTNNSAPTGTEYVQLESANSASGDPYLAVTYTEGVEKTQNFQWVVYNEVSDAQNLQWQIRNTAEGTQQFQWAVGNALAKEQQFQWVVGGVAQATQQFQWEVTYVLQKVQIFNWGLNAARTASIVLGLPDITIEVDVE